MNFTMFIFTSSTLFSICYIIYLFIVKKQSGLNFNRYFLLGIMLLSSLLPFCNIKIYPIEKKNENTFSINRINRSMHSDNSKLKITNSLTNNAVCLKENKDMFQVFKTSIKTGYFAISALFIIYLLFGFFRIWLLSSNAQKEVIDNLVLIKHKGNSTFSFFKFIFIPEVLCCKKEFKSIFLHEKSHCIQLHTLDILICELYNCIYWFNPLVWQFRNQLRLNHEYLADKYVLKNGINIKDYQNDMINFASGHSMINLVSNYYYSLKKRFIMMLSFKNPKIGFLQVFSIFLLLTVSITLVGFVNGQIQSSDSSIVKDYSKSKMESPISKTEKNISNFSETNIKLDNKDGVLSDLGDLRNESKIHKPKKNIIAAIELPSMNDLFIGVENPVRVAVAGIDNSNLEINLSNGQITKRNDEYIITVSTPGVTTLSISYKGKVIERKNFDVKRIPDPKSYINSDYSSFSGKISKDEILKWGTMEFLYKYFNLDLSTLDISYRMIFVTQDDDPLVLFRTGKVFDEQQLNLIKKLMPGDRIYFENINIIDDLYNPKNVGDATLIIE